MRACQDKDRAATSRDQVAKFAVLCRFLWYDRSEVIHGKTAGEPCDINCGDGNEVER